MAKLQHTFIKGKMNKDLDERLIPNGEYRDASNVQVSTSEGADVGAVENIIGNTKLNKKTNAVNWNPLFGLISPVCIGTIIDSQNNKIYWFLATDPDGADYKSVILEFDQSTGFIAPILVDKNNVINFTKENLITGINILGGLLFFTDNTSEPKVINIARFKAGSQQSGTTITTQTIVYGGDFSLEHVTVIVRSPNKAATVVTAPSLVGGAGTGVTPTFLNDNFNGGAPLFLPAAIGSSRVIAFAPPIAYGESVYNVRLTSFIVNENNSIDEYEIVGVLSAINLAGTTGTFTITSISANVPNVTLVWQMFLIEDEAIFKNNFPRFSYRWEYTDGEYSTYAPFTKASFAPGKFKYLSSDGYNIGMDSIIRKITLSSFQIAPANAVSVDILYKDNSSNNIYVVETIDLTTSTLNTITITSSLLGAVINSNQLLRPWDNVPRKAKSQEVIGNRIVYGNYLQNYNVNRSVNLIATQLNSAHNKIGFGLETIKTDRTYQLGITFIDQFNRESPVFTTKTAAISFDIKNSFKVNTIIGTISAASVPSFATSYKYYLKNPAAEYYNIALDRYYDASDGNIWLSFASSERNKVQEGDFLTLKKQHDTNVPVTLENRYKILDISNEAPDFIRILPLVIARVSIDITNATSFIVGEKEINFNGPLIGENERFFSGFDGLAKIQFTSGNLSSSVYSVDSGGPTGLDTSGSPVRAIYKAVLTEGIKTVDAWLNTASTGSITAILSRDEDRQLPEFQGRFFAKINTNQSFTDNVVNSFNGSTPELVVDFESPIVPELLNTGFGDTLSQLGWTDDSPAYIGNNALLQVPTAGLDTFKLGFCQKTQGNVQDGLWQNLLVGKLILFYDSDGTVGNTYTIIASSTSSYLRGANDPPPAQPDYQDTFVRSCQLDRPYTDGIVTPSKIAIVHPRFTDGEDAITSTNPAIFEVEPIDLIDLDIYYEASDAIPVASAGTANALNYFNAYSFGQGVESNRIRDDYNAPFISKGVRVSTVLDEPYQEERKSSSMIFSGIFNSISGVNNTNQFLIAENITKNINSIYGSIQKLHARDTDLIVLMEDKCFRVLADKDALFNADGSSNVASSNRVLGSVTPFVGEYGISTNPESFASFGFRSYFIDKSRGAVMRLSRDGLTKISSSGMSDYFIDNLKLNTTGNITGSYDSDAGSYNVCINVPTIGSEPNKTESVAFKEKVNGWTTTMSYVPEAGISLNNEYYTFKSGEIWEHSNETRSNFYGAQFSSTVTPIINDAPTSVKKFKTLAYEGTAGWRSEIVTDQQNGAVPVFVKKEGSFYNYIQGIDTTVANLDTQEFSTQGLGSLLLNAPIGTSALVINGAINVSLQANPQSPTGASAALDTIYTVGSGNVLRIVGTVIGINRTTNTITLAANIAGTALQAGDFVFFGKDTRINTSGIIGYYAETKMITDDPTKEELFSISSEVFISSE